ncbi:MAG: type II secretion system protein GspG [Candidatus Sungbacteria bacterium]|uniref:Type II secretion system protein GspG n=1 Tax=Candidatus Sungiibacteriota bacterium TaxID=2750080 RepID=A0A932YY75_9BACT|nr:type II secretion system protein GspG [Candidatus Sungbacteria bacterium]
MRLNAEGAMTKAAGNSERNFHLSPFGVRSGGFTIIELIVVLAIIALMTALGFALFSEARAKSRDAKRERDVKTLQDALSIYVTNAASYPTTDAGGVYLTGSDAVSAALVSAGAIQAIPLDPQNVGSFRYHYTSTDGFTYTLTYSLETNSIPGKAVGEHTASP